MDFTKYGARSSSAEHQFDEAKVLIFTDGPSLPRADATLRLIRHGPERKAGRSDGYIQKLAEVSAIGKLFDADYYKHEYPDIDLTRFKPLSHFLEVGWYEG